MKNLPSVAEIGKLDRKGLDALAAKVNVESEGLNIDELRPKVIDQVELLNAFATSKSKEAVQAAKEEFEKSAPQGADNEPIDFAYKGKQYRLNTKVPLNIPGIGRVLADELPEHPEAIENLLNRKYHLLVEIKAKIKAKKKGGGE